MVNEKGNPQSNSEHDLSAGYANARKTVGVQGFSRQGLPQSGTRHIFILSNVPNNPQDGDNCSQFTDDIEADI